MAQLFTHVRDAVIMIDPSGIVGFWSLGAAQIYDRSAPDALNRCFLELIPPTCRAAQTRHIHRALEGEESTAEWQTKSRDGEPMWLEGDFRPVHDPNGKSIGCAILLHDVTKWRAAVAAVKASDELLWTITDNIPGAVFQLRIAANGVRSVPFVSRGVEDLLERSPAEMHTAISTGNILVVLEDRPLFWETLDRSWRTHEPWDAEFRIRTARTDVLKWIRLRAVPTRLPDGATLWNGVMTDVSEQVAAAEALRESEARYRLLTENTTDLIARLSPTGAFRFVSAASRALLGAEPEEFVGRPLGSMVPECDQPQIATVFERMRAGQSAVPFAHRMRAGEGSYVWCESTVRAVHDPLGAVAEVIMVTRSIEERRKLEAKVRQSQKLEAVGRLAGGVAHDFNNLLTVINGFSEMIVRGLGNPDLKRIGYQIGEIRKAGERASALTRQLLAFGRQQVQMRTRVNLNDVVADTKKLLARVLGEDVEIETELAADLGPVHADVGQIEQVLMNLALNARDAMPDGGTLTLRTANACFDVPPEEDIGPGPYVMVAVSDTGVGMDESTRARAFEPFFTTKELGQGTGLGLATVYGIVKQSGGHIEIDTEIGRGATFRVFLPRFDSVADGVARVSGSMMITGRETILLVEDDDAVRRVTAAMLRTLGYHVVEASGGIEALRHSREHSGPIHLILTDVVMPMMNGREVAQRVQAILPGIKTLFMSGYTDDSILRHGVLDEGVAFLSKPLSHEALGRKLREVLGGSFIAGRTAG
jgi:PAS domain S-box-containing protein